MNNLLRFYIQYFLIGSNSTIYKHLSKYLFKRKDILVNRETDIVVEGFPRSGNTFAVALLKSLRSNLNIARHRHEIGHVKLSIKMGKPTIILIRNPKDAVISFFIREKIPLWLGFKYYDFFYGNLISYINNPNCIVVDFNELTNHTENFVFKLKEKFKLNLPNLNEEYIKKAKELVLSMDEEELSKNQKLSLINKQYIISVPNKEKRKLKVSIEKNIEKSKYLSNLLEKCQIVYSLYNKDL